MHWSLLEHRFKGGARGVLVASQINAGLENDLRLRISGERGTLEWRQEDPNRLLHHRRDGATQILTRGSPWLGEAARRAVRLPSGHPEGFNGAVLLNGMIFSTYRFFAAGSLLAMAQQSAYPDVMSLHQSGRVVMMVLVGGGLVSFWGPVLGVVFYFVARDVLGGLTETWLLWYGLIFMAMVMLRPEGLAGMLHGLSRRRPPLPTAAPAPATEAATEAA